MLLNSLRVSICPLKMPSYYYAVAKGRKPGIYLSWDECRAQVHQFSSPKFKKFLTQTEAEDFVNRYRNSPNGFSSTSTFKAKRSASAPREGKETSRSESSTSCTVAPEIKRIKLNFENEIKSVNVRNEISTATSSDGNNFIVDKDGYVNVYTDGACSSNGRSRARAGIGVWFGENHFLNLSEPVIGRATNNMAEIQAVTKAAEQAKSAGLKKLKINTDSQFLISCITQWMPKWKRNGWQTASKKPVINKTELIEMEKALQSLDVLWNHVNGHVGIYGNEMADKLARAGCENYKK